MGEGEEDRPKGREIWGLQQRCHNNRQKCQYGSACIQILLFLCHQSDYLTSGSVICLFLDLTDKKGDIRRFRVSTGCQNNTPVLFFAACSKKLI